ncbi:hypothetical protein BJ878DRAFT_552385 [Calycina marina]|uniref:Uncharacterized protein n=1 Tax=Calycina marina TaxID=1763456 RepID=A0A9P7ZA72_9HELO|nr:hypothetical protein BJ878DRAFT_552385 [Calycina marina]
MVRPRIGRLPQKLVAVAVVCAFLALRFYFSISDSESLVDDEPSDESDSDSDDDEIELSSLSLTTLSPLLILSDLAFLESSREFDFSVLWSPRSRTGSVDLTQEAKVSQLGVEWPALNSPRQLLLEILVQLAHNMENKLQTISGAKLRLSSFVRQYLDNLLDNICVSLVERDSRHAMKQLLDVGAVHYQIGSVFGPAQYGLLRLLSANWRSQNDKYSRLD